MPPDQKLDRVQVAPNKRTDGAIHIIELVRGLNKSYEVVSPNFNAAASPASHEFKTDMTYHAIKGWITCDGPGAIDVEFSRDGIVFGDSWRMFSGENTLLSGLEVSTLRITHLGTDTGYRVWLA